MTRKHKAKHMLCSHILLPDISLGLFPNEAMEFQFKTPQVQSTMNIGIPRRDTPRLRRDKVRQCIGSEWDVHDSVAVRSCRLGPLRYGHERRGLDGMVSNT